MRQLAPVDPNVKIPAGTLAASAKSDEFHKLAYPDKVAPEAPKDPEPEPPKEAKPDANKDELKTAPPAAPEPQPPAPQAPDEQSWEHRYKSMKGRYDSESARTKDQLRSLSEEISSLHNVIATLQASPPAYPDPAPAQRAERLLTPEEEKDYGAEFLSVVGKRAKEELNPEVTELKAQLARLESRLGGVQTTVVADAKTRMLTSLNDQVPEWRLINKDERFLSWLDLPDTYSGAIRLDLLKAAFARNDTARVLAFFKGFLAEEAALAPAPDIGPDLTPEVTPKVSLRELAAPGRAKTAAASPAPTEKPIITRAQIASFYTDVSAGRYRGKDDEKNRLERMIFEAEREKRIR